MPILKYGLRITTKSMIKSIVQTIQRYGLAKLTMVVMVMVVTELTIRKFILRSGLRFGLSYGLKIMMLFTLVRLIQPIQKIIIKIMLRYGSGFILRTGSRVIVQIIVLTILRYGQKTMKRIT